MKKPGKRDARRRLADPSTYAAMDAALKAASDRYDPQLNAIKAEIAVLLAGRKLRDLAGSETITLMSLKARFDAMATEQKHFAEADLQARLNPDEGTETVDA